MDRNISREHVVASVHDPDFWVIMQSAPCKFKEIFTTSLDDLRGCSVVAAIDEYIALRNTNPKPFIWTRTARGILQKVIRANSRLSSKQNATLH